MTALWTPEPRTPVRSNGHSRAWEKVDMASLMEQFDLVEVEDDVIVVTPHQTRSFSEPDMRELGVTGSSTWYSFAREDYNPKLRGQSGLRIFDEMRKSDGQIAMSLTLRKLPVLAARWYIQPASQSKKDKKIAEHIWTNLTRRMSVSWPLWLQESLAFLDFGWYAFEKVFERRDGLIWWRKLAPRHPMDSMGWNYDPNGGPKSCTFPGAGNGYEGKEIPIDKLVVFTNRKEGGNMEGVSELRTVYKHWYFKDTLYKIDAIQKERHAVGIPVIVLPPNYTPADKAAANQMGRNLRSNEKAHIVLPPFWEVKMLELEGQPVDVIASINHHDTQIARNVLAPFMNDSSAGGNDSDVVGDLYMKASRQTADVIRDGINKWAIPEIVEYNWGKNAAENPPELRVRRIGETVDWRTISFTLRNLVGANLLRPDKPLLDSMREEFDLPEVDETTLIETMSPQMPGQAGPPRQSQSKNQKIAPTGNAGKDGSGKAQGN